MIARDRIYKRNRRMARFRRARRVRDDATPSDDMCIKEYARCNCPWCRETRQYDRDKAKREAQQRIEAELELISEETE